MASTFYSINFQQPQHSTDGSASAACQCPSGGRPLFPATPGLCASVLAFEINLFRYLSGLSDFRWHRAWRSEYFCYLVLPLAVSGLYASHRQLSFSAISYLCILHAPSQLFLSHHTCTKRQHTKTTAHQNALKLPRTSIVVLPDKSPL